MLGTAWRLPFALSPAPTSRQKKPPPRHKLCFPIFLLLGILAAFPRRIGLSRSSHDRSPPPVWVCTPLPRTGSIGHFRVRQLDCVHLLGPRRRVPVHQLRSFQQTPLGPGPQDAKDFSESHRMGVLHLESAKSWAPLELWCHKRTFSPDSFCLFLF